MRLLEYESKDVFGQFGIPLANYIVINNPSEVEEKVNRFSFPAIVKSQIAIGSRKKAGLIKIAHSYLLVEIQTTKLKPRDIAQLDKFFARSVASSRAWRVKFLARWLAT